MVMQREKESQFILCDKLYLVRQILEIRSVSRVRYKLCGKELTKLGFVVYIQNCTSKGHFKFRLIYLFIIFDKTKGNLKHDKHDYNDAKLKHEYPVSVHMLSY
jgi:hypothetical protein